MARQIVPSSAYDGRTLQPGHPPHCPHTSELRAGHPPHSSELSPSISRPFEGYRAYHVGGDVHRSASAPIISRSTESSSRPTYVTPLNERRTVEDHRVVSVGGAIGATCRVDFRQDTTCRPIDDVTGGPGRDCRPIDDATGGPGRDCRPIDDVTGGPDRDKYLTAKYSRHQMDLIRRRLTVEDWLDDALKQLYNVVSVFTVRLQCHKCVYFLFTIW